MLITHYCRWKGSVWHNALLIILLPEIPLSKSIYIQRKCKLLPHRDSKIPTSSFLVNWQCTKSFYMWWPRLHGRIMVGCSWFWGSYLSEKKQHSEQGWVPMSDFVFSSKSIIIPNFGTISCSIIILLNIHGCDSLCSNSTLSPIMCD